MIEQCPENLPRADPIGLIMPVDIWADWRYMPQHSLDYRLSM
jgi:hypothetical protein